MKSLCNQWEFVPQITEAFIKGEGEAISVRIPHSVVEMPLHYGDSKSYQMVCGYRRYLHIGKELQGKRVFLQFDGAAHIATVYLNSRKIAEHRTGYTAFRVEITDYLQYDDENLVVVQLDTTENPAIPPFGHLVDYLTYGGLYREVWLDIRENSYIADIFVTTPDLETAKIDLTVISPEHCMAVGELVDAEGKTRITKPIDINGSSTMCFPEANVWSVENPYLYTCRVKLYQGEHLLDVREVSFGFRTAEFKKDGFYLNGEKVFLRGLNRHQSFPYIGYAAPESLQREDARILKEELGCNAVRTSHYPQSQYFIDECDRLGLLVFTEIPGWQHIGRTDWQKQACENTCEMILQYRNHPSIILWGVRINESGDCDELYSQTNEIAHQLDPSRATSGVRCFEKSSLLEDVYSYNDFSHTGDNAAARKKCDVTPDMEKGYLISECNGHIFPTKAIDNWERRQEHALRHARVQDAAVASGEHAGCFAWCMFDYATHKDFGAGDRICYHGVMDSYRNPKLAAAVYASQSDKHPVLEIGSNMEIGEYSCSKIGQTYAFTNADEVWLYKNDCLIGKYHSENWSGLLHGPVEMKGIEGYLGDWGVESTVWRFDAVKDGNVVSSVTKCPDSRLHLEVTPSHTKLQEGASYDMVAVRIRILDQYNNLASYAQIPVRFELQGDAELVGPEVVTAEGGMCGTYIRTKGVKGNAVLNISTYQTDTVKVYFQVTNNNG